MHESRRKLSDREFERLNSNQNRWDEKEFAERVCEGCNSIRGIQRPLTVDEVIKHKFVGSTISAHYTRGWSVDITIGIRLDDEVVIHKKNQYLLRQVHVSLNFSGSERSIAGSIAAISLYQEAVAIASEIEQAFYRTYLVVEETKPTHITVVAGKLKS